MRTKKQRSGEFVKFFAIATGALLVGCAFFNQDDGFEAPNAYNITKRDSIAVRAILDANGMESTSVQSVVKSPHGKIERIHMGNRGLTSFTITKDFDSIGYSFALDLYSNQIDTILVTDTVRTGFQLLLDYNDFANITDDFSKLVGPMQIFLTYNQITNISETAINYNYTYFSIYKNAICNASDSVTAWLNEYDYTWASSQTCP